MSQNRDNLCVMLLLVLLPVAKGLECDRTVHNFACHYYYEQLQTALTSDKNELFWLHKAFFPEQLQPPETIKITLIVTVGYIANQTCARNDQLPAYYYDGAQWRGEWEMTLSSSSLLALVSEDVLFALDNTILWALHAMATGLGSTVSEGNTIGMYVDSLPCMPSRDIVTETLILLGSRLKAFARYQAVPSSWDENDKVHVSQVYTLLKDRSWELLYEASKDGNSLMIVTYVMVKLLAALFLCKLTLDFYPKLWDEWVITDRKNAYSLYWGMSFVVLSLNIMMAGVMVIAYLYRIPDLEHCYGKDELCGSIFIVQVSGTRIALSTIIVTALLVVALVSTKGREEDRRSRITHVFSCGCCLFLLYKLSRRSSHNLCSSKHWIIPAVALASNLVFFQQVAGSVVPSFILLLLFPEPVISGLLFIVAGVFCIIVFTAHILHTDRYRHRRVYVFSICLQSLFILLLVILIGAIVAFYLLLLSHGIRTRGIYGFLLALVPSAILTISGHLARKYLFNSGIQTTSSV